MSTSIQASASGSRAASSSIKNRQALDKFLRLMRTSSMGQTPKKLGIDLVRDLLRECGKAFCAHNMNSNIYRNFAKPHELYVYLHSAIGQIIALKLDEIKLNLTQLQIDYPPMEGLQFTSTTIPGAAGALIKAVESYLTYETTADLNYPRSRQTAYDQLRKAKDAKWFLHDALPGIEERWMQRGNTLQRVYACIIPPVSPQASTQVGLFISTDPGITGTLYIPRSCSRQFANEVTVVKNFDPKTTKARLVFLSILKFHQDHLERLLSRPLMQDGPSLKVAKDQESSHIVLQALRLATDMYEYDARSRERAEQMLSTYFQAPTPRTSTPVKR